MINPTIPFILIAILFVSNTPVTAQQQNNVSPSDIQNYIAAYAEVRHATIEGVSRRLASMRQGMSADSTYMDMTNENAETVLAIYVRYGFTPGSHAAFGTDHSGAVERWLEQHSDWKSKFDRQTETLRTLTTEIQNLVEQS